MKKWLVAATLTGMIASGGAVAASGNEFLEECKNIDNTAYNNSFGTGFCLATMHTVLALMMGLKNSLPEQLRLCVPAPVTVGQAVKITVKYMQEHPELLHKDAVALTLMALQDAYPCE